MKIHHIGYLVKRITCAVSEFESLGFQVETPTVFDTTRKVHICFMVNNNYRIELISPEGKESPIYSLLAKYKNTPYHICYCTHDLETTIKNMLRNGFMIFQEPAVASAIQNRKVVFMISPEIGIIEILEEY